MEIDHGRVYRLSRGRYGPAYIPRSTEYRIHQRVLALRTAVVAERHPSFLTCQAAMDVRWAQAVTSL